MEKAVWSFNNAVATLNQACFNLIDPENMSDTNKGKIIGVRCIGSNPKNIVKSINDNNNKEFISDEYNNKGFILNSPSSNSSFSEK